MLKNQEAKTFAHEEHGRTGLRNIVLKNQEAKIFAHEEHGHTGSGLIGNLESLPLYSQEPGGKDPHSQRAWKQRAWLDREPDYSLLVFIKSVDSNFHAF